MKIYVIVLLTTLLFALCGCNNVSNVSPNQQKYDIAASLSVGDTWKPVAENVSSVRVVEETTEYRKFLLSWGAEAPRYVTVKNGKVVSIWRAW